MLQLPPTLVAVTDGHESKVNAPHRFSFSLVTPSSSLLSIIYGLCTFFKDKSGPPKSFRGKSLISVAETAIFVILGCSDENRSRLGSDEAVLGSEDSRRKILP